VTTVTLTEDGLDFIVHVGSLELDPAAHGREGGAEVLESVRDKVREVFDQLAWTATVIMDRFPGEEAPMILYLEGLKGIIIQYDLLFQAGKPYSDRSRL